MRQKTNIFNILLFQLNCYFICVNLENLVMWMTQFSSLTFPFRESELSSSFSGLVRTCRARQWRAWPIFAALFDSPQRAISKSADLIYYKFYIVVDFRKRRKKLKWTETFRNRICLKKEAVLKPILRWLKVQKKKRSFRRTIQVLELIFDKNNDNRIES